MGRRQTAPTSAPQTVQPRTIYPQTIHRQNVPPQAVHPRTVPPQTVPPQTIPPRAIPPQTAAGGRPSFFAALCQLISSVQSGTLGHEEEGVRAEVASLVVSTDPEGIEQQAQTDATVSLTFSQSPHDVTQYIMGKAAFPDDTSGGYSDVYKCILNRPGKPRATVAVKALRFSTSDTEELQRRGKKLRGEVHIWIRLDHPNVLKLHGITGGFARLPALVSPWVENGTLTKYLEVSGRNITRTERISILVKVAGALHYIHSHHVVHGDLTGSNILINGDGEPLISDFGLSSILDEYNKTSYFKSRKPGAFRWAAPELLKELPKPSINSDVYSYGCVMLHTSGKIPFSELHDYQIQYEKIQGRTPWRPNDLPIEQPHWDLIENCLYAAPEDRPKLPDICASLSRQGLRRAQLHGSY
ncbi:kinase-like domain-containing protein [Melanogaster broomeanus]|nr:kinase-like domain-containing protein [Melanogaster broomeanus]